MTVLEMIAWPDDDNVKPSMVRLRWDATAQV